jgi:hypothetical protein
MYGTNIPYIWRLSIPSSKYFSNVNVLKNRQIHVKIQIKILACGIIVEEFRIEIRKAVGI